MTTDPTTGLPPPEPPSPPRRRLRFGLWIGAGGSLALAAIVYFLFVR